MADTPYSRYAEALFALSEEDKSTSSYQAALKDIQKEFEKTPSLMELLSSYAIEKDKLYQIVDEDFSHYKLKHLCPFIKSLVANRTIPHFADIVVAYSSLANASKGVKEGIIYSTYLLSEDEIHSIEKSLSSKLASKVELTNRVEKSLLGGVRVYVDGKVFDGSVASKLDALRAKLLRGGEQ
jgi:F-type H+-transporting ATPase subunit delta